MKQKQHDTSLEITQNMNRKSVPKEPSETRRLERWRKGRPPGSGDLKKDTAMSPVVLMPIEPSLGSGEPRNRDSKGYRPKKPEGPRKGS